MGPVPADESACMAKRTSSRSLGSIRGRSRHSARFRVSKRRGIQRTSARRRIPRLFFTRGISRNRRNYAELFVVMRTIEPR